MEKLSRGSVLERKTHKRNISVAFEILVPPSNTLLSSMSSWKSWIFWGPEH